MSKWKVVSVEPTREMLLCICPATDDPTLYIRRYNDLLKAAPRPIATDKDVERVAKALAEVPFARKISDQNVWHPEARAALRAMGWETPDE